MSFFKRGTPQEREKEARKYLPDIISDDVFKSIIVKYMNDVDIDILLKLPTKDLCQKLQDQKEGPILMNEVIENDLLLKHLLILTAGTEKNKDKLFWIIERNRGPNISEDLRKHYNGDYLIELCITSVQLKNYLLENSEKLKEIGLIDDTVIADIKSKTVPVIITSYPYHGW